MADDNDEIILADLPDDELVLQMHDDLYDGLKEEIEDGVNILLGRGWTPYDVLTKALVAGMTIVGADFRDGMMDRRNAFGVAISSLPPPAGEGKKYLWRERRSVPCDGPAAESRKAQVPPRRRDGTCVPAIRPWARVCRSAAGSGSRGRPAGAAGASRVPRCA